GLCLILFLLSLPALVIPFVTFTSNASPLGAAEKLTVHFMRFLGIIPLLGLSFFAGVLVVIWKLRQLLGPPGRWELWAMLAAVIVATIPHAIVMGCLTTEISRDRSWPSGDLMQIISGWAILLFGFGIPLLGMALAWQRYRRQQAAQALEILAMTPFLANAAMCLVGFHDDPELGYWLTLWIALLWMIE